VSVRHQAGRAPFLRHLHARLTRAMVMLTVGVLAAATLVGQILRLPPWVLLLGAVPTAALVGNWLSRIITERLTRLRDAVEHLELDGSMEAVPVEGLDEVADLARAVNRLARRLASQERVRRDFFADVAHELRHPLSLLMARLEAIQDGAAPLDLTAVGHLSDAAGSLSRLIDDVRDLSLAEVGQLHLAWQLCDVGALVLELQELLEPLTKPNAIRMDAAVPTDPVLIWVDPGRLRQVLLNLLSNAIRHTPPAGAIEMRVSVSDWEIEITVSDTGPGIPPDRIPQLFRRFDVGRPDAMRAHTGGTGLGLAVVRSLVEAHGGGITVTSVLGQGTHFVISLPKVKTSRGGAPILSNTP